MKTYTIVSNCDGEIENIPFESTRKRDILAKFNKFCKNMNKYANCTVRMIREGYAEYTFTGDYGMINGEYYIVIK